MIDLGYMAKRIAARTQQLQVDHVVDIYSVCDCISDDFADYVEFWEHNEFNFFDSPQAIWSLCEANDIPTADLQFFFYRGHDLQYDDQSKKWVSYGSESKNASKVESPKLVQRVGYDVVTYSKAQWPEHSPLSCNYLAAEIPVNQHCLIDSLDDAIKYLETGRFENSEPGPLRIIEVNTFNDEN